MKKQLKRLAGIIFFLLLIANVFFYTKTMVLADEMVELERRIKLLHLENIELEKQLSRFNSLSNLNRLAKQLGFTENAQPIFFDNLYYALATPDD